MTNPVWLTMLVAVLGPVATMAGQWMAGVRQVRLAKVERDARRDERAEQRSELARSLREECYGTFLRAARAMREPTASMTAIEALQDAVALIELRAPELADSTLPVVLASAERLATVRRSGTSPQVIATTEREFAEAVAELRRAMRADVA